ncbi:poly-A polymerase [Candidatus Aerophobetes bacterium]|uniref:Poly-A polymerase n=1 Tax=Aerophobetes bacterium TaxID=2030807 RepID=A0A2A4X706_UNCAE|nr:MAG: poly-A polymerase [Candidatus Aerophobetes bacterium]
MTLDHHSNHYSAALSIATLLKNSGFIAYFVGGWVRDHLLKHPSSDIDIATDASCDEIIALFPKTIPVGIAFGVVVVIVDAYHFEVATFREEEGYKDGRRPTRIKPSTPEHDAKRRDFTINGLFFDPETKTLIDYVEGQKDLKKGIVRAIGNPQDRFAEDKLRMIRAARYTARFGFALEHATKQAIIKYANTLLPAVSVERIVQEFSKMQAFDNFDKALVLMHELKLLPLIIPQTKNWNAQEITSLTKQFHAYPKTTPLILYIMQLLPTSTLEEKLAFTTKFKFSKKTHQLVQFYHASQQLFKTKNLSNIDDATWVEQYASPWFTFCLEVHLVHIEPEQRDALLQFHVDKERKHRAAIERAQTHSTLLTAHDLEKEGIFPSALMGTLLRQSEKIAINHNLSHREEILQKLKQSNAWPQKFS